MPTFQNGKLTENYVDVTSEGFNYYPSGSISASLDVTSLRTESISTVFLSSGSVTFTSISGSDSFELYTPNGTASITATPISSNLVTSSISGANDSEILSTTFDDLPDGFFPSETPTNVGNKLFFATGSTLNESVHNLKTLLEGASFITGSYTYASSSAVLSFTSSIFIPGNYGFKSGSTITTFSEPANITSSVLRLPEYNDASTTLSAPSRSLGLLWDSNDTDGLNSFIITGSGISKVYLSSSGKFGIGTTDPKNEVDIKANTFKIRSEDGKREIEFGDEGKFKARKFSSVGEEGSTETTGSEVVLSYTPGTFEAPLKARVGDIMGTIRWEDESFAATILRTAATPMDITGEIVSATTDGVAGEIGLRVSNPASLIDGPEETLKIQYQRIKLTGQMTSSGNISSSGTDYTFGTTRILNGNITASGDISASGDIFGDDLTLESGRITQADGNNIIITSLSSINISASGFISASSFSGDGSGLTNVTATATIPAGTYSSSLQTLGNITSSGNISASGDIEALTFTSPTLDVTDGSAQITANIPLIFGSTLSADLGRLNIKHDDSNGTIFNSTGDLTIVNQAGSGDTIIANQTSNGRIILAPNETPGPNENSGQVLISGSSDGPDPHLFVMGNITASGTISASGTVTAPSFKGQIIALDNVAIYVSDGDYGSYYSGKATGKESGDWASNPVSDPTAVNDEYMHYGNVLPVSCSTIGFRGGMRVGGGGNAQIWIMTGSRSIWASADLVPLAFGASASVDLSNGQDFKALDIPEFEIGPECDYVHLFVTTDDSNKVIRGTGTLFART